MKTAFKRLALMIVSTTLSLVLLEGLLTAFAWSKYGTIDVDSLTSIETGNTYAQHEPAGFATTISPHPYLGYVRNEKIETRLHGRLKQRLNNVGLFGRDFPLQRDPAKFTILLTGGSVAEQVGKCGEDGQSYLEAALNRDNRFGRPVVVLNGANGGWKQPQQAIMALLYGDVVDAVVTLDGFNERTMLEGQNTRLENPPDCFYEINPLATGSFSGLAVSWQCQQLKQFSSRHPWRTIYFATRFLRGTLEQRVHDVSGHDPDNEMFRLSHEWSKETRIDFNLAQYEKYIRSIETLAHLHGVQRAFFIQPCPAVGKELTPDELRVVGKLGYRDSYLEMESRLLKLQSEGLPIASLANVFEKCPQTLYADTIHCECGSMTDVSHDVNFRPSEGYRIMSEALAERLADFWSAPLASGQTPE